MSLWRKNNLTHSLQLWMFFPQRFKKSSFSQNFDLTTLERLELLHEMANKFNIQPMKDFYGLPKNHRELLSTPSKPRYQSLRARLDGLKQRSETGLPSVAWNIFHPRNDENLSGVLGVMTVRNDPNLSSQVWVSFQRQWTDLQLCGGAGSHQFHDIETVNCWNTVCPVCSNFESMRSLASKLCWRWRRRLERRLGRSDATWWHCKSFYWAETVNWRSISKVSKSWTVKRHTRKLRWEIGRTWFSELCWKGWWWYHAGPQALHQLLAGTTAPNSSTMFLHFLLPSWRMPCGPSTSTESESAGLLQRINFASKKSTVKTFVLCLEWNKAKAKEREWRVTAVSAEMSESAVHTGWVCLPVLYWSM